MASNSSKILGCMFCKSSCTVNPDVRSVLCGNCVARLGGAPEALVSERPRKLTKSGKPRAKRGTSIKKAPSGFPRGWHFKKFYRHTDGTVWSRGKQVTDTKLQKKLEKEHA